MEIDLTLLETPNKDTVGQYFDFNLVTPCHAVLGLLNYKTVSEYTSAVLAVKFVIICYTAIKNQYTPPCQPR